MGSRPTPTASSALQPKSSALQPTSSGRRPAFASVRRGGAALLLLAAASLADTARADAEADRWADWLRLRALTLDAEGRPHEAAEEWVSLAAFRPRDRHAAARAAVALVEVAAAQSRKPEPQDPEYRTVEHFIREAVARGANSNDPAVAYAIGRLRFADGNYKVAEDFLGTAVQRGFDPARARFWHGRALISDCSRLVSEGGAGVDVAVERLRRLVDGQPTHPDLLAARINLAIGYRMRGEHVPAEQVLSEVLKAAPWAARAHMALAEVYADLERRDEASAEYKLAKETAVARDDGIYTGRAVLVAILRSEAQALLRQGDIDGCERAAKHLLELEKDTPLGIYLLGMVELRRGNTEPAIRLLRRAKRLEPGVEALSALAQALHAAGLTQEGEEVQRELDLFRQREQEKLKREKESKARGHEKR